jgi:hypothetical protein
MTALLALVPLPVSGDQIAGSGLIRPQAVPKGGVSTIPGAREAAGAGIGGRPGAFDLGQMPHPEPVG